MLWFSKPEGIFTPGDCSFISEPSDQFGIDIAFESIFKKNIRHMYFFEIPQKRASFLWQIDRIFSGSMELPHYLWFLRKTGTEENTLFIYHDWPSVPSSDRVSACVCDFHVSTTLYFRWISNEHGAYGNIYCEYIASNLWKTYASPFCSLFSLVWNTKKARKKWKIQLKTTS